MKTTAGTRLRVGIFVIVALLLGAIVAFSLGAQENVFKSKTDYFSVFEDVGGLQAGNTVRVAGVNVGSVTEVGITEQGDVIVYFRVIDNAKHMIRGIPGVPEKGSQGSFAAIGSKGLLGDRMIEISVGADDLPEWDPALPLPVESGGGLIQMAERALTEVEGTAHNLKLATDPFADQVFSEDLKKTASNLAETTGKLAKDDGTIQALMSDPALSADVKAAVRNIKEAAGEAARLGESLNRISTEIETGDGTAHALIYGEEGAAAIANLNKASEDIAHLTEQVREGKGTVGAFLVDPSVYNDIKRLLGDMERNDVLRSLVRYSIHRDEALDVTTVRELEGADSTAVEVSAETVDATPE